MLLLLLVLLLDSCCRRRHRLGCLLLVLMLLFPFSKLLPILPIVSITVAGLVPCLTVPCSPPPAIAAHASLHVSLASVRRVTNCTCSLARSVLRMLLPLPSPLSFDRGRCSSSSGRCRALCCVCFGSSFTWEGAVLKGQHRLGNVLADHRDGVLGAPFRHRLVRHLCHLGVLLENKKDNQTS